MNKNPQSQAMEYSGSTNKKKRLVNFAEQLIRQKKIIRSVQNLLVVSFICLSLGILLSIPMRYFLGTGFIIPFLVLIVTLVLTFIYGFLGIESHLSALKDADEKMSLNEKLSAAFQFGDSANPYAGLLMDDALQITETLKANQIYQIRFSRRDPFQPLLLALFFFLWMSSFSFLQISDSNIATGEMLVDTSEKIDAVNREIEDKDIEDIAEEYRKLGQKIQDQFMNDQSIENEVEELSQKLEKKIEELSREGVDKDSQTLDDDEADSELYQLNRKEEMSQELNDILQNMMKTFSLTPDMTLGGMRQSEGGESGNGEGQSGMSDEPMSAENGDMNIPEEGTSESVSPEESSEIEKEETTEGEKQPSKGDPNSQESSSKEGEKNDNAQGNEPGPTPSSDEDDEKSTNSNPGSETADDTSDISPMREEKQSGEFDEDNIRGELRDGEQMKSFIRALPHIAEPTREEMEVIHFYRNQLETAIDKEILPESYHSVVRDYFLGIGVLNE